MRYRSAYACLHQSSRTKNANMKVSFRLPRACFDFMFHWQCVSQYIALVPRKCSFRAPLFSINFFSCCFASAASLVGTDQLRLTQRHRYLGIRGRYAAVLIFPLSKISLKVDHQHFKIFQMVNFCSTKLRGTQTQTWKCKDPVSLNWIDLNWSIRDPPVASGTINWT